MKYAFMMTLNAADGKVAKRDTIYAKVETFLSGKAVWGRTEMSKGDDKTGNPSMGITVRFDEKLNLNNLFDLAKTELNKLTGVTATLSRHDCYHDEGGNPCVLDEAITIVR